LEILWHLLTLSSAPDAILEFCEKNNLTLKELSPDDFDDQHSPTPSSDGEDDSESAYSSDDAPTNPTLRKTRAALSYQVLQMSGTADKLKPLVTLLSPEKLTEERDKLANALKHTTPAKRLLRGAANPTINAIIGGMAANNILRAVPPGVWTDNCIHLVLTQVRNVLQTASLLMHNLGRIVIEEAATTWQISRSLLVLYGWYNDAGPALAEMLVDALMTSPATLEHRFPQFAPLTKYVHGYVKHIYDTKANKIGSRRKKSDTQLPMQSPAQPSTSGKYKFP
jgi:hypothetical protein